MPTHKKRNKGKGKITDAIKSAYNYAKNKVGNVNQYLKEKRFIHNLIGPANYAIPINAIWHAWGIDEKLKNGMFGRALKTLDNLGYGKKTTRKRRKK